MYKPVVNYVCVCVIIKAMKQISFILLFISLFCFYSTTDAQINVLQTDVNIQMVPENPGPNEITQVSVASFATNINSANITWKINGKTQKFGVGEKVFSFTTGDSNTTTLLEIIIETLEGETIRKTYNIKPVEIDLLWESDGFVPPFYKGKALLSHQNKISLIAIPHITSSNGVEIGSKNLIYTWKKNGSVIEDASGFGKNTYTFYSSLISRPLDVSVEVSTVDMAHTGFATINLTPKDPQIVFYKKDPSAGIEFQKSLKYNIEQKPLKEVVVVGFPLFFGVTDPQTSELTYKWTVNGVSTNNAANQNTQVFRQKEGTSGTSKIGLTIENSRKILQYASSSFDLSFGNNNQQN